MSSDIRLRVKQARPVNLNDAIRHAVELEAFHKTEQKHKKVRGIISDRHQMHLIMILRFRNLPQP